jgi:short-subunit dehydrogenase
MNKPVAVITGASRGIGYAIAQKFASEGFNLFIGGTNLETISKVSTQFELDYGIKCSFFAADLSVAENCKSFCAAVIDSYPQINVLVNNAGVFLGGKMMEEDESQLLKMMNTNLFSAYHVTKNLWDFFAKNAKSHVFNLCSIASFTAYPAGGSYSITKFALHGFTKSLRLEGMEKGICVSSVMPGATLTDSWAGVDLPESRFMKPDDVSEVIFTAWKINNSTVMEEIILRPILGDL